MRYFCIAWLVFVSLPALGDSWIEAGHQEQYNDNNSSDALTTYIAASTKTKNNLTLYGELSNFERFGRADEQAMLGTYAPITASGQWHGELSASNSADLRPIRSAYAGWYQTLPRGWTIEPGLQSKRYDNSTIVERYSFTTEYYFSAWRLAYSIAEIHQEASSSLNHRIQTDYYYSNRSRIGIGYGWGEDIESLPGGIFKTSVQSLYLTGQYQLNKKFNLVYQANNTKYESLYNQVGWNLGLRYFF